MRCWRVQSLVLFQFSSLDQTKQIQGNNLLAFTFVIAWFKFHTHGVQIWFEFCLMMAALLEEHTSFSWCFIQQLFFFHTSQESTMFSEKGAQGRSKCCRWLGRFRRSGPYPGRRHQKGPFWEDSLQPISAYNKTFPWWRILIPGWSSKRILHWIYLRPSSGKWTLSMTASFLNNWTNDVSTLGGESWT